MLQLKKTTVVLALGCALGSCQSPIREDRSDCPATLFFEFIDSQGLQATDLMHLEAFPVLGAEGRVRDTTTVGAMDGKSYSLQVKRSDVVSVYGMACFGRSTRSGESGWVVDAGKDGDPLYRFSAKASGMDEQAVVPVEMTKEHSTIRVKFTEFDQEKNNGRFPYRVVVKGNTCGIDLYTGNPIPGPFRFLPDEGLAGVFVFTVPRQADHSLSLQLMDPAGSDDESPADTLVLWNVLKQVEGFSWDLPNLPDLSIEIDYIRSQVTVSISDWQTESFIHYPR